MKKKQQDMVLSLMRGDITKEEFSDNFDHEEKSLNVYDLILKSENEHDGDSLELSMYIGFSFGFNEMEKSINLFNKLLTENWHHQHEDIAKLLKKYKYPSSAAPLYKAIGLYFKYLDLDDEYNAFHVKCIWALGDIRNKEAVKYLNILSNSDIGYIKENAKYQLMRIEEERN